MHSSGMRTDRSSRHLGRGGGLPACCPPSLIRPHHILPDQTAACENTTFPASLRYAVGNNFFVHWVWLKTNSVTTRTGL